MNEDDPRYLEEIGTSLFGYLDEDGRPWWFNIRDGVLREIDCQLKGFARPSHGIRNINMSAMKYSMISALRVVKSMGDIKACDYFLQVPARYDMNVRPGAAYNIYSDSLFSLLPSESVLFEHSPTNWACPSERVIKSAIPGGIVDVVAHAYGAILDRIKKLPEPLEELSVTLIENIGRLYGARVDLSNIMNAVHIAYRRYVVSSIAGGFILKLLPANTKLILLVGGIYSENSHYIYLAKKRGIAVAELQHGAFDSHNIICSPAPNVCSDSRFAESKPDYWLFYGDWWASQTMMPSQKIIIGNPYHELKMQRLDNISKCVVLFVGNSKNTEDRMRMVNKLRDLFPQYKVAFRPHPIECNEAKYLQRFYPGVFIDSDDLYRTLQRCVLVVGPYSTVLFEAVGIADQVMLLAEGPANSVPRVPFPVFRAIDELPSLICNCATSRERSSSIWHADWRTAFSSFISDIEGEKEDHCQ